MDDCIYKLTKVLKQLVKDVSALAVRSELLCLCFPNTFHKPISKINGSEGYRHLQICCCFILFLFTNLLQDLSKFNIRTY